MHLRAFMDEEKDEPTAAAAVAAMVQELGGSLAVVVVYSVKVKVGQARCEGGKSEGCGCMLLSKLMWADSVQ